jgi:uncharacterized protein YgbK (DUF1537 family)
MLAILADDLTGALDAAAPFAGRGLAVTVALSAGGIGAALAAAPDVIALPTNSREIAPDAARVRVAAAVAALPADVRVFKKVDSRLKGNIAAELEALSFSHALVAPAIPDFGRFVEDGAVTGFGVETPIPVAPCLGRFAKRAEVPNVRSAEELAASLAATSADLLIGARGLADALAAKMTGRESRPVARLPGPALFVVGSRDPITLAQVAKLDGRPGVRRIDAPNGYAGTVRGSGTLTLIQALPAAETSSGEAVSAALAGSVHPALTQAARTILLTGGATAEAVLSLMGVSHLRLLGECLPGLAVAEAAGVTFVTKSGGFGDVDALDRVADMLEA